MSKYFVGRYASDELYRCRLSANWWEPGEPGGHHTTGDVIWRGDNQQEGREVAKKTNAEKKK